MINRRQYTEYLISTSDNYTCSNLAEHLDGVSHDTVSDYLRTDKLTARGLWERVHPHLKDSEAAYLLVDDSVQNKQYSQQIELVKKQYSGAEHGLVRGIGVVNLVHSDGEVFYPIDYRIYASEQDGKSKNEHFREMLIRAKSDKELKAKTILFDSWYAAAENLKLIVRLDMYFVTTLKSNRMVSLTPEGGYVHLQTLEWNEDTLEHGLRVKLKELPFRVQLFKGGATNGDIDWVITSSRA
jgi:hypothetical protein